MLRNFIFLICLIAGTYTGQVWAQNGDQLCGKWMSSENNLTVQVYKNGDHFRAKIIWFKDDPSEPMEEWRDKHNPDPKLRSRKLLGMDVLSDLRYDADDNSWEDGTVYDAKHGHNWDASAYIDKQGLLRVRGYWHFKLFGKTMVFKRVP